MLAYSVVEAALAKINHVPEPRRDRRAFRTRHRAAGFTRSVEWHARGVRAVPESTRQIGRTMSACAKSRWDAQ